jgi:hypothetical protein
MKSGGTASAQGGSCRHILAKGAISDYATSNTVEDVSTLQKPGPVIIQVEHPDKDDLAQALLSLVVVASDPGNVA